MREPLSKKENRDSDAKTPGDVAELYSTIERLETENRVLREREAHYRFLFDALDDGFCIIEKVQPDPGEPIDFRFVKCNPAFEKQSGVGNVVGRTIREAFSGESQEWFDIFDRILRDGNALRFERSLVTQARILELYAFPLDVVQSQVGVIFRDVTERRRDALLARRLAAIVESSDDAIVSKNLDGIITSWNRAAERMFGYSAEEIVGKSIMTLIPPERRDEEDEMLDHIRRGEHLEHYETVRQRKDGSKVWVSLSLSPLKDTEGKIVGASKIARDMTERKRNDEHRKLLIRELNHRLKNTLAMVQSIATQSFSHGVSFEEAREAFGARLLNLARAHDILTQENWSGANLADVVAQATSPHADESRFVIDGPTLQLSPNAALAVSMAVHELCTNATKYGALSTENGHVSIHWEETGETNARRLMLCWEEVGGPPVSPPTKRGFGSRLIERALAQELNGTARVEYAISGVVCTIVAGNYARSKKVSDMAAEARRVLIVEDEVLIAINLEDMLTAIGHLVIDHASRLSDALEFARDGDIDFAVLDINLAGVESFPVADVLRRRGIPFIFATAYDDLVIDDYRNEVVLTKPYSQRRIENAMARAISKAAS